MGLLKCGIKALGVNGEGKCIFLVWWLERFYIVSRCGGRMSPTLKTEVTNGSMWRQGVPHVKKRSPCLKDMKKSTLPGMARCFFHESCESSDETRRR
jgi:hypothetical protein